MRATRRPLDNRPPGKPKITTEVQIGETDGHWWCVVTLKRLQSTWCSPEIRLTATSLEDAQEEAAVRVSRFLSMIGDGPLPRQSGNRKPKE